MSSLSAEYRSRRPTDPERGHRAANAWARAVHRAARRRNRHAARAELRAGAW